MNKIIIFVRNVLYLLNLIINRDKYIKEKCLRLNKKRNSNCTNSSSKEKD